MQLEFGREIERFRSDVREFIRTHLPPEMASRQRRITNPCIDEDGLAWHRILATKGWSVPHWPQEYGGCGWSALQLFVFEEECHYADAPVPAWQNTHMVGPVIYTFGSQQQKERFLPPLVRGDCQWAQGFSEPSAGSDLASLRTSAARHGDRYVVNGQKIWTSGAHVAEWGFFLVRTNPDVKPQAGISFILIDMRSPGITVRRIPQMNGHAHVCEVFLDNVEVPMDQLVGEEGGGWSYAKFLLDHERTASAFIYQSKRELQKTKTMAKDAVIDERPLLEDPIYRSRMAVVESELLALEWSVLRVLADEKTPYHHTAVASVLKIAGSSLQQRIAELQADALALRSLRFFPSEQIVSGVVESPEAWPDYVPGRSAFYMDQRAATIYGGALQVQKNIIAKLAFGL